MFSFYDIYHQPNRIFLNSHIKFDTIITDSVSSLGCSELHGNCAENNHVNAGVLALTNL